MLRKALAVLAAVSLAVIGLGNAAPPASAQVDVYSTPGHHKINGRDWRTTCENYTAQIQRCRTEIRATQIVRNSAGQLVKVTGWTFNNLTYLSAPRSLWAGNPLAETRSWTAADSRLWRTECDTATTGRNGCRSYIYATYYAEKGGRLVQTSGWLFNNQVRFGAPAKPIEAGVGLDTQKVFGESVVKAVNRHRVANGLPEVAISAARNADALACASANRDKGSLSHTLPGCSGPGFGENLAKAYEGYSAQRVVDLWIKSPAHNDALLAQVKDFGVGYACDAERRCFVALAMGWG